MTLNRNPTNYFAETEQVMFQPGHIVRGIDFSEDPLLQGRIFSYLDTQLNRNGGPNFEQLPINQPRVPIHNNNRDGMGQMLVHANTKAYSPNTFSGPKQANQKEGRGFFTAPTRKVHGHLNREKSKSFDDVYSQPRLFYNSLLPTEQQFLVNAIRFETSHLKSDIVKANVLKQLNLISNEIATQVSQVLDMPAPAPVAKYYHNKKTTGVSVFEHKLLSLKGLKVGFLATKATIASAASIKAALAKEGVTLVVVAETLGKGVDETYSAADSTDFDGVIVADVGKALTTVSTFYPAGRPLDIITDSYRYGKPVGFLGGDAFPASLVPAGPGVYTQGKSMHARRSLSGAVNGTASADLASSFIDGLKQFRFLDRFAVEKS